MFVIKRRTIIAIFITILLLVLTNSHWLILKPLPISFDISGNSKINIEIALKKNTDVYKSSAIFDLTKQQVKKVNKNVKTTNFGKSFNLTLKDFNKKEIIELSNFNFRDGKLKLEDLSSFKVVGANSYVQDNKLVLEPTDYKITIEYPKSLKVRATTKFDFRIFVIIAVLSFLLAYKLSDYVADFSSIKGKSRVDIIFLSIFFVLLFIPMMHINQEKYLKHENRTLAVWKPFINADGQINYNFGNDYNAWFNDRFNFRECLIKTHYKQFLYTANRPKGIVDSKNNWLYNNNLFSNLSTINLSNSFDELKKMQDFFEEKGIKFYTLIVPRLTYIYPSSIIKFNDDMAYDINKQIKRTNLSAIYPLDALRIGAQQELMFFKTDHHWTDSGAFIAYKELMELIKKDFPNVKILSEQNFENFYRNDVRSDFNRDFFVGHTCSYYLKLSESDCNKFLDYKYKYYKHKDFKNLKVQVINKPLYKGKDFYYSGGQDYKVVLFGTSMSENLTEFIPFNFKYVKRIRNNNVIDLKVTENFKIMKYWKNHILNYNPDFIIFCITVDNLSSLDNIFKE